MTLTEVDKVVDKFSFFVEHSQVLRAILVILVAFILSRFLQKMVYNIVILFATDKNKSRTNKLLRSYCNIIATVLKYLVYIFAVFSILAIFNVDLTTIIASAGFIGVLITYIFQDLIKDITNGFFIVFSSPFEIGDRVKIDGFVGKVKEIESRYVVLNDVNGNRCVINNRKIDSVVVLDKGIHFNKKVK